MAEKGFQRKRNRTARVNDKQDGKKRAKNVSSHKEPSPSRETLEELQHVLVHSQSRNNLMDSDETQPPSDSEAMLDDSNHSTPQENLETLRKKKNGRGRSKCLYLDMNTGSGKKLKVTIPDTIGRPVGDNARKIVNFCGVVVRAEPKLSFKTWPTVRKEVGDIMLAKVKDKFEVDGTDDSMLNSFIFCTMQRLYRVWKGRLHKKWSSLSESDRLNFVPPEVDDDDWSTITKYWESEEFKKVSKRNKENRGKNFTKHTCGSVAFVEKADRLNAASGEELTADELWEHQHTKKNANGEKIWCDPVSEGSYHQLKDLGGRQGKGDVRAMTNDEMLVEVLGKKSGYFRGKGAGVKAPSSKGTAASLNVHKIREEIRTEMQSNFENMEEERRKMDEERAKFAEERARIIDEERAKLAEERAKMKEEFDQTLDKALKDKIAALFTHSQLSQFRIPVDTPDCMKDISQL